MLLSVTCLPQDSWLKEGAGPPSFSARGVHGVVTCSRGGDVVVEGCEFPSQTRRPRHGVGWC